MGGLGCCMGVQLEATGQAGGGGGRVTLLGQTIKGQYRRQ